MFTGRDRYNEPAGIVCFVSITSGLTEIAGEYAFTSREMGILMLVIKGFSNSEIAGTLDLSLVLSRSTFTTYTAGQGQKTWLSSPGS